MRIAGNLFFFNRNDLVHIFRDQRERDFTGATHGNSVGNGGRGWNGNELMLFESQQHGRQPRGFHADHLHFRARLLDGAGDAGNQTAAAHGNNHRFELRALLEQLQAESALPRDYSHVVEGVKKGESLFARKIQGVMASLVVIKAVENYVGPVILRGRHFHQGRSGGHDDGAAYFAKRGVIGDGLGMISRGSADDAALLFFGAEQKNFVERAAFLVGAGHLQIFELEIDLLTGGCRELGGIRARRIVDGIANAVGGLADHAEELNGGGFGHVRAFYSPAVLPRESHFA